MQRPAGAAAEAAGEPGAGGPSMAMSCSAASSLPGVPGAAILLGKHGRGGAGWPTRHLLAAGRRPHNQPHFLAGREPQPPDGGT